MTRFAAPVYPGGIAGGGGRGMRFATVCSGIEAASQAWAPLGWKPQFFSEIEPFPCAYLAHHYPDVPNRGDMTKWKDWPDATFDVLAGGTPCQSFSVAGLRAGLADPRGNLMLTYLAIARRYRPRWLVWENVPGVLSSNGGRDFGTFLRGLGECGYGFAYRVLDAQFVRTRRFPRAVPQRRRRVWVVGYLGDWRPAAAVLFDAESLRGNPAPRRETGQRPADRAAQCAGIRGASEKLGDVGQGCNCDPPVAARSEHDARPADSERGMGFAAVSAEAAPTISARPTGGGGLGTDFDLDGGLIANSGDIGYCLTASAQQSLDAETETETLIAVAHSLRAEGHDASEDGTGRQNLVPVAFGAQNSAAQGSGVSVNYSPTLDKSKTPAVAFDMRGREGGSMPEGPHDTANIRAADGGSSRSYVAQPWAVRRLTPVECERLMGFPDNATRIPYRGKPADQCPDGPRYKALGNSWAVNCAEWIGERIELVEAIMAEARVEAAE